MRFPRFLLGAILFAALMLGAAGVSLAAPPDLTLHHPLAWGQTLADVSERFGVPVDALAAANGISDLHMLHPGRWLTLPDVADPNADPPLTYTIQPGDTLSRIAMQFGTTVEALAAANGIADPSLIQAGQALIVPGSSSAGTADIHVGPLRALEWTPAPVRQGQTLIFKVQSAEGATLDGTLEGRPVAFTRDEGFSFAIVPIGAGEAAGTRDLVLWAGTSASDRVRVSLPVLVAKGNFEGSVVTIPADRTYLLDPQIMASDREQLARAYGIHTVKRHWSGTFLQPIQGPVTTPFGAYRMYNDGRLQSRHGGIDLSAVTGTPIQAANAGRVVFAGTLQVYGNGVIIDHGLGLFSAYFHMHTLAVQAGQMLAKGDLVGTVGNTGLSTGAHLHWEMRLNNVPIDPVQWMNQTIP